MTLNLADAKLLIQFPYGSTASTVKGAMTVLGYATEKTGRVNSGFSHDVKDEEDFINALLTMEEYRLSSRKRLRLSFLKRFAPPPTKKLKVNTAFTPDPVIMSNLGFEELRQAQMECLGLLFEGNDVLAVLPTGYGKTAIAAYFALAMNAKEDIA